MVAVSFMNQLPPAELIAALRHHAALAHLSAENMRASMTHAIENDYKPRHVDVLLQLSIARIEAEITWSEGVIAMIERGELP